MIHWKTPLDRIGQIIIGATLDLAREYLHPCSGQGTEAEIVDWYQQTYPLTAEHVPLPESRKILEVLAQIHHAPEYYQLTGPQASLLTEGLEWFCAFHNSLTGTDPKEFLLVGPLQIGHLDWAKLREQWLPIPTVQEGLEAEEGEALIFADRAILSPQTSRVENMLSAHCITVYPLG